MNRIILIGNGFDLAHGLKTSYADFIDWYWSEWGKQLKNSHKRIEDDRLCSFALSDSYSNWFNTLHFKYQIITPFNQLSDFQIAEFVKANTELFKFSFKSTLFKKICDTVKIKNWVDVEDIYYLFLKSIADPKQINDDLEYIKDKLIDYLKSIQQDTTANSIIQKQILGYIFKEDIAISSMDKWDKTEPDNIMLLNFNYTNTADMYLTEPNKFTINYIHGTISNPGSVIFGYGDERDDKYEELMKKNDNEYLRHIKSFQYLDASGYRDMLSFTESAPYQLCIMGHSCGLSDRTLLASLFEHPNCASIKPYYYQKADGTDNYRELVQNIARSFRNPALMRDRVVRKERCEPLGK